MFGCRGAAEVLKRRPCLGQKEALKYQPRFGGQHLPF